MDAVRSHTPVEVLDPIACAPRFLTYGCAQGIDRMHTALEVSGRRVTLGAHPVGIDVGVLEAKLAEPEVQKKVAMIKSRLNGTKGIISIERLDYVKGAIEKLETFERLLEEHPELVGKVTLLNVVTPAAPGMEVYEQVRIEVDRIVGRINGRFSTLEWTPIQYSYGTRPFEDVVAYYAACDVAWITPLRDGLNLVSKEYVAVKHASGEPGVLILSEFAGGAVELHGALLANPYDADSMVKKLHRAIVMGDDEKSYRCQRMAAIVAQNNVKRWGDGFIRAAKGD